MTVDVRYNSQRVMATRTTVRALGVSTWLTLHVRQSDPDLKTRQEVALTLWLNSTLGMLFHADHANPVQHGRGRGNKGLLETLPALDVRQLQSWQLDEAQSIYLDYQDRRFESFHRCAVDPARIELDQRIIADVLGLPNDAQDTVATLRELLATDPSMYGSKPPALPT